MDPQINLRLGLSYPEVTLVSKTQRWFEGPLRLQDRVCRGVQLMIPQSFERKVP